MTPDDLNTLAALIGAFCLGAGCFAFLIPFLDREVFVTTDRRLAAELHYDGHRVRLITSDQWITELEQQARREAMDAGMP